MKGLKRALDEQRGPIVTMILGGAMILLFYMFIALEVFGFAEPGNIGAGFMPLAGFVLIMAGLTWLFLRRNEKRSRR